MARASSNNKPALASRGIKHGDRPEVVTVRRTVMIVVTIIIEMIEIRTIEMNKTGILGKFISRTEAINAKQRRRRKPAPQPGRTPNVDVDSARYRDASFPKL